MSRVPDPELHRPIFLVAPPRSGAALLDRTLARSPNVWSLDAGSYFAVQAIAELANGGRDSERLTADDAQPVIAEALRGACRGAFRQLHDWSPEGEGIVPPRLLEGTPRNALRVAFLDAVFPDAAFVYLYREPGETIASMVGAWESGRFVTNAELPDWPGPPWSLLLIPGWQRLRGLELAEIVTEQWCEITRALLDDLEGLSPERWSVVARDALVEDPQREVERLCRFLDIEWRETLTSPLALARQTTRETDREGWSEHEEAIQGFLPRTAELAARARAWIAAPGSDRGGD
jgi:hypothetical protein